eukprot:523500_1
MSCNSFSFIPFTNTLHSWKYDKAKYYRHVLSGLFSVSPNETAKNARIILQSTIDEYIQQVREDTSLPEWSETHFANLCTEIKQNTRHGGCTGSLSRYELRSARGRGRVNRVVTHLKALFDGLNECEVLNILNVYSVSHPVQYGHAIKAISTLKNVLQSLTAQYRYSAAQKAKQSILSSLFILNEQGDLENGAFINQLTDGKINTKLIKRIIQTRTNYDTNQSVYLYDAKFDGKYKTMQRMNPRITESITNYWTLNTVPSPHANETRITNHKVRDARTYICGEWNKHVFKLKPPETEDKPPGKRRLTRGADLKLFVLDYHQLKVMKASDFEHKKAFTELNIGSLKTLNKYLSIIHCMQRKGVTFTQKFGDESMKHVVKNYLEYDKLELLYKDEQNQINSDFTLDMQGLGIELDHDITMNNATNHFTLDMPSLGSELDNAINSSNATNAIECVSGLRLPVINGTNVTQYGHHADRNAISWNDNVSFRHNPMNSMRMQEPRNAFGSGYYNPYM